MRRILPDLILLAVLLAAWPAASANAAEGAGPLAARTAALADLERVTGLGVDPAADPAPAISTGSSAAPETTSGQQPAAGGLTGTNGISGSAFSGATGLVTSIQNLGDNVVIHNITNVTVNIR